MSGRIVWPADEGRDGTFAAQPNAKTPKVRVRVLIERWGAVCELCGTRVDEEFEKPHPAAPEADHIIPTGSPTRGPATWANLRLVHAFCNNRRRGGNTPPDELRVALKQRVADFDDQLFWFADRARQAQANVAYTVGLTAESEDGVAGYETDLAGGLRTVYGNLLQLDEEAGAHPGEFDYEKPEKYDSRLEGLLPWATFVQSVVRDADDDTVKDMKDMIEDLESGRVLPGHVVASLRRNYGDDWEEAFTTDFEGYDEIDEDGAFIPHGTGDQFDGGFGPDSYFAHAMQKDE